MTPSARKSKRKILLMIQKTCWICHQPFGTDKYSYPTLDHILPKRLGGNDSIENLSLAHPPCNTLRGNAVAHLLKKGYYHEFVANYSIYK